MVLEKLRVAGPPRVRLRVLFEPMPVPSCTFWLTTVKLKEETEAKKGERKLKSGHKKAWAC
jgi:hypothetical protein